MNVLRMILLRIFDNTLNVLNHWLVLTSGNKSGKLEDQILSDASITTRNGESMAIIKHLGLS